jgi:hypothetical protein
MIITIILTIIKIKIIITNKMNKYQIQIHIFQEHKINYFIIIILIIIKVIY